MLEIYHILVPKSAAMTSGEAQKYKGEVINPQRGHILVNDNLNIVVVATSYVHLMDKVYQFQLRHLRKFCLSLEILVSLSLQLLLSQDILLVVG